MSDRNFKLKNVMLWLPSLIVAIVLSFFLHAFDSGLDIGDETAHFLNSYFIWTYLTEGLGQNPLDYAKAFYLHYPMISIGHWPPLYYAYLSTWFFILPHTPESLIFVNLVTSTLPALVLVMVLNRFLGSSWAVLGGLICVLTPITIENSIYLLLDQVLSGLVMIGMVIWIVYVRSLNIKFGLYFALIAAISILVKGNGWVLGFFPIVHIIVTRQFFVLLSWKTYISGLLALVLVIPWYFITYKISADGFNYEWGFDYFVYALPVFMNHLTNSIGLGVTLFAILGAYICIRHLQHGYFRDLGIASVVLVITTLLFHSIIPVDTQARYIYPAVPACVLLAVIGAHALYNWLFQMKRKIVFLSAITAALVLLFLPGFLHILNISPKTDLEMDNAAELLIDSYKEGSVFVVDAHSAGEGSFIAELALRDSDRKHYVIRTTELLSQSGFMGDDYILKAKTPEEVISKLSEVGASAVIMATGKSVELLSKRYPHSEVLEKALHHHLSPYQLIATFKHRRQEGETRVYISRQARRPVISAVKEVNFPEKAKF